MAARDLGRVVGPDGKSAYQYAVEGGFPGTEAEFKEKLAKYPTASQILLADGTSVETALSDKADVSVQQTVEAVAVPSKTVTLTAAELPAYIAALPRLLTEDLLLYVSGTVTGTLEISGFYGSGSISINGLPGGDSFTYNVFTVNGGVSITKCFVPVFISGMTIVQGSSTLLSMGRNTIVDFHALTLTGTDQTSRGISIYDGGQSSISGLKGSNLLRVITIGGASTSRIAADADSLFNNKYGIQIWRNGIIALSNATPTTLGGSTNMQKDSGCIIQNDAFV